MCMLASSASSAASSLAEQGSGRRTTDRHSSCGPTRLAVLAGQRCGAGGRADVPEPAHCGPAPRNALTRQGPGSPGGFEWAPPEGTHGPQNPRAVTVVPCLNSACQINKNGKIHLAEPAYPIVYSTCMRSQQHRMSSALICTDVPAAPVRCGVTLAPIGTLEDMKSSSDRSPCRWCRMLTCQAASS